MPNILPMLWCSIIDGVTWTDVEFTFSFTRYTKRSRNDEQDILLILIMLCLRTKILFLPLTNLYELSLAKLKRPQVVHTRPELWLYTEKVYYQCSPPPKKNNNSIFTNCTQKSCVIRVYSNIPIWTVKLKDKWFLAHIKLIFVIVH